MFCTTVRLPFMFNKSGWLGKYLIQVESTESSSAVTDLLFNWIIWSSVLVFSHTVLSLKRCYTPRSWFKIHIKRLGNCLRMLLACTCIACVIVFCRDKRLNHVSCRLSSVFCISLGLRNLTPVGKSAPKPTIPKAARQTVPSWTSWRKACFSTTNITGV